MAGRGRLPPRSQAAKESPSVGVQESEPVDQEWSNEGDDAYLTRKKPSPGANSQVWSDGEERGTGGRAGRSPERYKTRTEERGAYNQDRASDRQVNNGYPNRDQGGYRPRNDERSDRDRGTDRRGNSGYPERDRGNSRFENDDRDRRNHPSNNDRDRNRGEYEAPRRSDYSGRDSGGYQPRNNRYADQDRLPRSRNESNFQESRYEPPRPSNRGVVNCTNCGGRGHSAALCPSPAEPAQTSDYRDPTPRREYNDSAPRRDYNDPAPRRENNRERFPDNPGRMQSRDEGRPPREQDPQEIVCFRCNETGHRGIVCPQRAGHRDEDVDEAAYDRVIEVAEDDIESRNSVGIDFSRYDSIDVIVQNADGSECRKYADSRIDSFEQARLPREIMQILDRLNYKEPTPVQKYAIPIVQDGRDMLGCAQTGSGKTAAFVLPIVDVLIRERVPPPRRGPQTPYALILAPTRELVTQITKDTKMYCVRTDIKVKESYGGVQVFAQKKNIFEGCHILVGTTGRTKDFLDKGVISLSALKFLVLDEADRMLDMGFQFDLEDILGDKTRNRNEPIQTLMFSATFPSSVRSLVDRFMSPDYIRLEVGVTGTVNKDIKQVIEEVSKREKRKRLLSILNDKLGADPRMKILVFVESKKTADFIACLLSEAGLEATSIHGDRLQVQRERALSDFQKGSKSVLVATSVAARGLDIKNVSLVINYDLPAEIEEYIHRVGRTGRLGNKGLAISFYDEEHDSRLMRDLQKALDESGQTVPDFLID